MSVTQAPVTLLAHVDDERSVAAVLDTLRSLHGPDYAFALRRWRGAMEVAAPLGTTTYLFVVEAEQATTTLERGDRVRGPEPGGPFRSIDGPVAEVTAAHPAPIWPGDVVTMRHTERPAVLTGQGAAFEVVADPTPYPAPRLAMLRNLPDHPAGCAAYPGAFRREALPPARTGADDDRRGVNRVNEHTLDMRDDRWPLPRLHYHGPVTRGGDAVVNHSETALVLSRSVYRLSECGGSAEGHVRLYRRPAEDHTDYVAVPVRPGSILVTPGAAGRTMGHRFMNAFAMLVAIPGFVAPTTYPDEKGTT